MGANHARVYSMLRAADLVGVADPDRVARERIASIYGVPAYDDHRHLLPNVDAVSIAVPTRSHLEVAIDCLRQGLHVLVEKPIAADLASGEAMLAEAGSRGRVLQVGHIERFNPAVTEAARVIAGERVLAISARRLSPPTPHVPEDVVLDLLIHDLDIAMHLASSPVASFGALGALNERAELALVMAHVGFENGILADLIASKMTQQRIRELDITTDRSHVTVNYRTRDVSVYRKGSVSVVDEVDRSRYMQEAVIEKPSVPMAEPLYLELEHFLGCVRGTAPRLDPREAVASLAAALRIRDLALGSALRRS